jgi:DNA-binding transcriptional LysR family regulator
MTPNDEDLTEDDETLNNRRASWLHFSTRGFRIPKALSLDLSIDRAYVDIVKARFDAGIRTGERLARDMIAVRISDKMPFVVTASPAFLKKHGIPDAPQDLTKHACIRFRLPSGALVPWRFGKKRRTFEVHVEGPLIASEPGIAITAAIDGAGLMQLPAAYVAPELAAGRFVTILADWDQPQLDSFFLYYPSRRQMRPPLRISAGCYCSRPQFSCETHDLNHLPGPIVQR